MDRAGGVFWSQVALSFQGMVQQDKLSSELSLLLRSCSITASPLHQCQAGRIGDPGAAY